MKPREIYYELTAAAFEWEISPGKKIKAWGFNGQLPGPVIRAKQNDRLIVKLKNELPETVTIHWHGVRLPAEMDGTDQVQTPVQPGGEFTYDFLLPDAGTFWYHSHQNETAQMEKGMYGSLVVASESDPVVDSDRVMMIDDMKLDSNNNFYKGNPLSRWIERHDGREGTTLLINGKEMPTVTMAAGQTERWRLINASSARYFLLSLGGRSINIIGTDGGLTEKVQEEKQVLLTPGERLDILAGPFGEGETFFIESLPYDRVTFVRPKQRQYARVEVGAAKPTIASIPSTLRKIEPLATPDAAVNRKIKLSVGPSWRHGIDFLVNDLVHGNDKPVTAGELQVWEISNTSLMDHPFHLHGFFFQVLQINGTAPSFVAWKDTVNIPPRSKVKIAWMPDDRPGVWMYHCHILEHHHAGMMANFEVVSPGKTASETHARHHHGHHH